MALQNSGTIGIGSLRTEFSTSAGALSSYYRDGPIVPGLIPGGLTPGNTRPGNTNPGNPRPGTTNPCKAIGPKGPGSASIVVKTLNKNAIGTIGGAHCTQTYSAGGPKWNVQLSCASNPQTPDDSNWKCSNTNTSNPRCNGDYVRYNGVPYAIGASSSKPTQVNSTYNPTTSNPPSTNPPTTNPPTTNPPVNNPPTPINQPVPTSGTISLNNFYGAYKP